MRLFLSIGQLMRIHHMPTTCITCMPTWLCWISFAGMCLSAVNVCKSFYITAVYSLCLVWLAAVNNHFSQSLSVSLSLCAWWKLTTIFRLLKNMLEASEDTFVKKVIINRFAIFSLYCCKSWKFAGNLHISYKNLDGVVCNVMMYWWPYSACHIVDLLHHQQS